MSEGIRNSAVKLVPGKTFLGTVRGRMNNDVFDGGADMEGIDED